MSKMTREERKKAIEVLDDMKVKIDIPKAAKTQNDRNWALDVAIQTLSQEPCDYTGNEFFNFDAPMVKKSMEQDAISREAVLNLCTNDSYKIPYEYEDDKGIHRGYDEYRLINYYKLKLLPPVTPQPSEHFIDGVHAMGYREGYKDAQKQKSGKWIPVSERLPKEGEDVLACFYTGEGNYKMMVSRRSDYNYWSGVGRADIVSWMPLPEPYKAESEDKG